MRDENMLVFMVMALVVVAVVVLKPSESPVIVNQAQPQQQSAGGLGGLLQSVGPIGSLLGI